MHRFLASIGLKKIDSFEKENTLLLEIIKKPKIKKVIPCWYDDEMLYAELGIEFVPGVGIKIAGLVDSANKFHMIFYYPYFKGRYTSVTEECSIGKKMDNLSFSGMCENDKIGVSLIFNLINTIDYVLLTTGKNKSADGSKKIRISGLCSEGIILLPTIYSVRAVTNSNQITEKERLVEDAKNGDAEAIEKLTLEEMNIYSQIGRRLESEDVFSIVETSIVPYGVEAEVYKILGIIVKSECVINPILDEKVYILAIKCNGIVFDIVVNEADLEGEPLPGRRFRGIVWLQGIIEF
ncbi:MAG: DUF3881 family protein [Lachnospiraceae bacterium]